MVLSCPIRSILSIDMPSILSDPPLRCAETKIEYGRNFINHPDNPNQFAGYAAIEPSFNTVFTVTIRRVIDHRGAERPMIAFAPPAERWGEGARVSSVRHRRGWTVARATHAWSRSADRAAPGLRSGMGAWRDRSFLRRHARQHRRDAWRRDDALVPDPPRPESRENRFGTRCQKVISEVRPNTTTSGLRSGVARRVMYWILGRTTMLSFTAML